MQKSLDPAAEITRLKGELAKMQRAVDLKAIALRRANGWLADRISDVDRLKEENASLREGRGLPPAKQIPFDTLEFARQSLQQEH